ncbi:MAG: hypothetical protein MUF15_01230, partial [Acidobacteria bacterium]|nr:hypothetical protein [Acidobacteriota bacterium]
MKRIELNIMIIGISIIIFVLDFLLAAKNDGSLLIALLFWGSVGQGIIALAAATDLSGGKWMKDIRLYLLEYYPLLIMFPVIFLIFGRHISVYPWAREYSASGWLNASFFISRNVLILLLPYLAAHFYVRSVKQASPRKGLWAVLYLFIFTVSQSFMAFDIVMTFEYPWINTLFGGFFLIESLYGGIAFGAILSSVRFMRNAVRFKSVLNDIALLMMGFALLWVGLFYSQYLVIWYGNVPEEVFYISRRLEIPLLQGMGIYVLLTLFFIPFFLLISRKIRSSVKVVFVI